MMDYYIQKMKFPNYKTIAFGIVIFFSIIGVTVFSTAIHEISHWYDYRDYESYSTDQAICILNLPVTTEGVWSLPLGYYRFSYSGLNETSQEEIKAIGEYTEIEAHAYTYLILGIFGAMVLIVLFHRMDDKYKLKEYEKMFKEK